MSALRLVILFTVALLSVTAQNIYIDNAIKALNKVDGLVKATPAFKPCVVGVPLNINPWLTMTNQERKDILTTLSEQTLATLTALDEQNEVHKDLLIQFDTSATELVDAIVDGIVADALTPPITVTPAPTTTRPGRVTPAPTTPAPTTMGPTTTPVTTTVAPIPSPTTTPVATTVTPITPEPTTMAPVNNTTCNVFSNKDRVGADLSNVHAQLAECAKVCETTQGCVTYTWNNYNGGTCWLKSSVGALVDKTGVSATDCVFRSPSLVCNAYKDIDFVGMDIANKPAKSHDACCDICAKHSGCTAYTWSDYNGGTCWLKKSVGQVVFKVGVTSSSTVSLWGPVCPFEYDTDFVGMDIGNVRAADAGVCCSQCKANKDCKAYTWSNHNGGTCWMKSGKGQVAAGKGMISAKLMGF